MTKGNAALTSTSNSDASASVPVNNADPHPLRDHAYPRTALFIHLLAFLFSSIQSVDRGGGRSSQASAVVWWDSARLNACSAFFALPFRRVKSPLALSVLGRFRSATFRASSEG